MDNYFILYPHHSTGDIYINDGDIPKELHDQIDNGIHLSGYGIPKLKVKSKSAVKTDFPASVIIMPVISNRLKEILILYYSRR